ncbi:MAG: hypothetical protein JXB07_13335 [Anaerolineae bacterium]|nr:hypothetical protein [Anaerolineae bacterium]
MTGKVACLDADGNIVVCDPEELDRSPIDIPVITWEQLLDFVWCGQNYE